MTASLGVLLWHGGFRGPAQLMLAAIAAVAVALLRPPRSAVRTAIWLGLAMMAAANAASLLWHWHRDSVAPVLAVMAVAAVTAVAAAAADELRDRLAVIVLGLGLTAASAGIAGLALHARPLAERIAGVWRAQGTFEYPPALGLLCVCALASALALHATGTLDRTSTAVVAAILAGAAGATFDRAAWIATAGVLALFAARVPAVRRTVAVAVAAGAGCALLALAVSHPSRAALERHLRHGPISSRSDVWHASWDAAGRRPLLGFGPGRFTDSYETGTSTVLGTPVRVTEAHDAVLQQAVEAGIVAAAGAALALAAMLWAGIAAMTSRDPIRLALGVTAAAVALSGLYDFTWSFPPLLLLGALAAVACREKRADGARADEAPVAGRAGSA